MQKILIIGCGYIGKQIAATEKASGNQITAAVRRQVSLEQLLAQNICAHQCDLDIPDSLHVLPVDSDIIFYLAPPPRKGVIDTRMQNFVSFLDTCQQPDRIVLISTTGIYGNCHGNWITETTPANPMSDRARRRLSAETVLREFCDAKSISTVILRVPGIYGPGKLPVARILSGKPVLSESESPFSNRIHEHDLVRACIAAAHHPDPRNIYNISDGHPSTMTDYFNQVADTLKLDRPPQISKQQASEQLSGEMLSYLAESKRIDNTEMKTHLGVMPDYPDLAKGLKNCVS